MKSIYVVFLILILFVSNIYGQLDKPDNFPAITTNTFGQTAEGNVFLSVSSDVEGVGYYVFNIDNEGAVINYRELPDDYSYDFKMQSNGQLSYAQFISHHSYTGGGNCEHIIMDQEMNILDTFQLKNRYIAEAHDFQLLPNGHALMFGYYLTQMDLSEIVDGGYPDAKVSGGIIQELDSDGNVIFQWRTWDHYTPEEYDWVRANRQTVSAFHLNTINEDIDGNIIFASPRFTKKLNRQTGDIMWHLGGSENEFSFIGIDSITGVGHVTGHAFYRLKNGNFLVYDNAARSGSNTSSETHEYKLDEVNKTAKLIWTYAYPEDIKAWHRGNSYRLPNGNTIIGWGGASGDVIPTCTEVDEEGNIVFEAFFDNPEVESYRAFRFPMGNGLNATQIEVELAEGNTYEFIQGDTMDTGVRVEISTLEGSGYNELVVSTYSKAPLNPRFELKDPRVLPQRITLEQYNMRFEGKIYFDKDIFQINEPEIITVYYRSFDEENLFIPLNTTYNFVTGKIIADIDMLNDRDGEFVFGFPDIESIAFPATPVLPEDGAAINQNEIVNMEWSPNGFFMYFTIQIALDSNFTNIVLEEQNMYQTYYDFECTPQSTYYWRLKTFSETESGYLESDWSDTAYFYSSEPNISILSPIGNEMWQYGLDYFIKWSDNIKEDVIIELYDEDVFNSIIDTTESDGAYKWTIPIDTQIGCKYKIVVKSFDNETLLSESANYFSITDTNGNDSCSNSVAELRILDNLNVYPNPSKDKISIDFTLSKKSEIFISITNMTGRMVKNKYLSQLNQGSQMIRINVSDLIDGIYLVSLKTEGELYNKKFVKHQ